MKSVSQVIFSQLDAIALCGTNMAIDSIKFGMLFSTSYFLSCFVLLVTEMIHKHHLVLF